MRGWAFPKHRPQIYARNGRSLAAAQALYSFGRDLPWAVRRGIGATLRAPGARRLVSAPADIDLPVDPPLFDAMVEACSFSRETTDWAVFRSSWRHRRFLVFAFDSRYRCTAVLHAYPRDHVTFHPEIRGELFRVPEQIAQREFDGWVLRCLEPMPAWHRPLPWDAEHVMALTEEISGSLARVIDRPEAIDPGWVASHGDLTPWNARVGDDGKAWVLDWEWAGWAPPHTDILRFAVTHRSLEASDAESMAEWIMSEVPVDPSRLREAARYWLTHHIYDDDRDPARTEDADGVRDVRSQAMIELRALEIVAESGTSRGRM